MRSYFVVVEHLKQGKYVRSTVHCVAPTMRDLPDTIARAFGAEDWDSYQASLVLPPMHFVSVQELDARSIEIV